MLRVYIFITFLIAFISSSPNAIAGNDLDSKNTLSGVVVDDKGEPLAGVAIRIQGIGQLIYSDFDGKFQVPVHAGSKIQIKFSGTSFENKEIEVTPGNHTSPLKIQLNANNPA